MYCKTCQVIEKDAWLTLSGRLSILPPQSTYRRCWDHGRQNMHQRYVGLESIWFGLRWRFGTDVRRASRGCTMFEAPCIPASIQGLEKRYGWQQVCRDCRSEQFHNQTHRMALCPRGNLDSGYMGRVHLRVRYLWLCPWRRHSAQRGLRLHRLFGQQCSLAASWWGLDGQSCRIHFAIQEL